VGFSRPGTGVSPSTPGSERGNHGIHQQAVPGKRKKVNDEIRDSGSRQSTGGSWDRPVLMPEWGIHGVRKNHLDANVVLKDFLGKRLGETDNTEL
jgi:hypothetical protein